jgi:hypothetical protein
MRTATATISALLLASPCWPHPYLPLHEGDVTVLDYHFHVETDRKEFKLPDRRGKMIITTERTEEKNGKPWARFRVSYRDMPTSGPDVELWRREEDGNVYVGAMRAGKWHETLELARDLSVGAEWDYDDGERSRRKVTKKLDLEIGDNRLGDCVEITRSVAKKGLQAVINRSYYCRDVGEVKSYFEMPSPVGDYVTETSLRKHEPSR